MIRYITAGESHGKCISAILEGIPAGLKLTEEFINIDLALRQKGYGRGPRMKSIEHDKVSISSGVRHGKTMGSPITLTILNKDWENWKTVMSTGMADKAGFKLTSPRPGHVDLAGIIKFNTDDIRNVSERASARGTAVHVAVGAVCKKLLNEFGIKIISFTKEIGGIKAPSVCRQAGEIIKLANSSPVRCLDKNTEKLMIKAIGKAEKDGDTLGGVFTVIADKVPVGLGSHTQWDLKLDARLAQAVMSIQAVKGVEIGYGFDVARKLGSQVHDEILYSKQKGYYRKSNNAGGIEGGISNGEPIIVRAAMKPIPTLRRPLASVDILTKKRTDAQIVRSDVCAVPSAGIIGEAVVAIEIARVFCEKFGGDSIEEMKINYTNYLNMVRNR
ncbi:MAG: chorismate synthase [Elusimicrobia bacterium]|nr:chorismate synthase [Elusimicrobiota bacterium]